MALDYHSRVVDHRRGSIGAHLNDGLLYTVMIRAMNGRLDRVLSWLGCETTVMYGLGGVN